MAPCGTDRYVAYLSTQRPELIRQQSQYDLKAAEHFRNSLRQGTHLSMETLPVVFHIVHQGPVGNITDAEVLEGLQYLNEAFANTGIYNQGNGVNTQIQFCLAKRDPQGNATTGINRVESELTNVQSFAQDLALKDLIRWDPLHYINIWLVNSIQGGIIAGYAFPPAIHGQPLDGIVMLGPILADPAGGNSTLVHEMGHYLGLYHTFQNGCTNNDCLLDGDQVCDTPPDNSTVPPGNCTAIINSCTTDAQSGFASDQNDLNWNYLDYGNHACRNGFTQGQSERMNFFMENVRYTLLESKACQDPCPNPIQAAFTASATEITTGTTVSFANQSSGASNYQWLLNGTPFSTANNPSYLFDTPGTFNIVLQASNNDPNCYSADSLLISVNCNTNALFNTSNLYPKPNETVNFTNISSNGTAFLWTVNDNPIADSQHLSYSFAQPGPYTVCLETEGAFCKDLFCQLIFVYEEEEVSNCDGGFVMWIGEAATIEEAFSIISTPDGNILIGGRTGNKSLLRLIKPSGDLIWEKVFNFTNGNDFISLLQFDSEKKLLINGRDKMNGETTNFFVKYDYFNQNIIWSTLYTEPAYSRFLKIFENPLNGNYMYIGTTEDNETSINNTIMECDRNSGALNWMRTYDSGGTTDVWNYCQIYQNNIYTVGVERYGGLDKIKSSFSKLDFSGNQIFTKIHLKSPNSFSRLYGTRIFWSNDTAFVLSRGSLTDGNLTNSTTQFYATSLNGTIIFSFNYDITTGSSEFANKMIQLPDGFAIFGRYFNYTNETFDSFIFRIKKNGTLLWAKGIDSGHDDNHGDFTVYEGKIYFTISSQKQNASSKDILLGKIDLNGDVGSETCPFIVDLQVNTNNISSPYSEVHNLSEVQMLPNISQTKFSPIGSNLPSEILPDCNCDNTPYCPNGAPLHQVPDAYINSISYLCGVDSLAIVYEICNQDSFPLPQGTPVAIYNGNPTNTNAALLAVVELNSAVLPNECRSFHLSIPSGTGTSIYLVANDDGSLPTPFNISTDFPSSSIAECDYSNNMGLLSIDYVAPPLNLEEQLAICEFQPLTLDAGPGFASYIWQDGSTGQTYTAWQPGTYWVTARDSCGGIQTDTTQLIFDPASVLDIGLDSIGICAGDSVSLSLSGFDNYQWTPNVFLSCDTCSTATFFPDSNQCYFVVAGTEDGCYSIDTLCIIVKTDTAEIEQYALLCSGDSINFNGTWITDAGTYEQILTNGNCLVLNRLIVEQSEVPKVNFSLTAPCPGMANGAITAQATEGLPPFVYQWDEGTGPTLENISAGAYFVTVTDSNGCKNTDSVLLEPTVKPTIEFVVSAPSCTGFKDASLEIASNATGFLFGLSPQSLNEVLVVDSLAAGLNTLFFQDSSGCLWDTTFLIPETPPFWIALPADTTLACRDSLLLQVNASHSILTYNWSPKGSLSCTSCSHPVAYGIQSQTYTLTATSLKGCVASDSIRVTIDDEGRIYIPNAFSPNGDGINDIFYIFGKNIDKVLVFRVFDRWGGMVHEAVNFPPNDPQFGWDGQHRSIDANIEVYAYYTQLQLCNGSIVFKKGDVTVMR